MPADWQLPPGVSRGLWDYLHDPAVARDYDAQLADTGLFAVDQTFVLEHCPAPGRIIDLGCGTGRLTLALGQRGYQVLAVDLSAEMLNVVAHKAKVVGADLGRIPRLQANLVQLDCLADASFDYAACLFSTLGMIQGAAPRRRFLMHVRRILRPGGVFVLHVHNRWFHLGTRAGRRLLLANLWNACWGRGSAGDFSMPPHEGHGPIVMHLFTRREMRRLLKQVGFEIFDVRPIGLGRDARLPAAWWMGSVRAYGYLIAARRA